jgi:serine/threonine protein kinase
MTVVPGSPIGRAGKYTDTVGGVRVGEAYWKARADIHRLGIAHNDAHPENIFIDDKGKGRWVDMGLAQGFPKAALAEAMGVTPKPEGSRGLGQGDWQGARWRRQTGLNENLRPESDAPESIKQIQYNAKYEVAPFLRSKGLNDNDIAAIATHGIRQGKTTYDKGPWAKISDEDAMQAINLLYQGVE